MADYIRARSPEHKQERMETIMAATDNLFKTVPYHDITLSVIAKELGWSRANLYKYVSTKEEVFLSLHSAKNRAYCEDLANALDVAPMDDAEFARIWAQVTEQHADYLKYQDILIAIIETNVELDRLVAFKRAFADMVLPVHDVLSRQCGLANAQAASDLYLELIYQATGLYNHFNCAELTKRALELAGMPPVTGTFVESYARFVAMCLKDARER